MAKILTDVSVMKQELDHRRTRFENIEKELWGGDTSLRSLMTGLRVEVKNLGEDMTALKTWFAATVFVGICMCVAAGVFAAIKTF